MQSLVIALVFGIAFLYFCDDETRSFLGYAVLVIGGICLLKWPLLIAFVAIVWLFQHIGEVLGMICAVGAMYVLFKLGGALGDKYDHFVENRAIGRGSVAEQAIESASRVRDAKQHTDDPHRRVAPFIDGQ